MKTRETVLNVAGMSCPSCVRHVTAALAGVPGILKVEVRLRDGVVEIQHEPGATAAKMIAALRDAGYASELRSAA